MMAMMAFDNHLIYVVNCFVLELPVLGIADAIVFEQIAVFQCYCNIPHTIC